MIIDAHMHLGEDLMYNSDDGEEDILNYMSENRIDGVILQTGLVTNDARKANERIYRFSKHYPGKIWGMLALSPYMPEEEYINFAKWAVNDLGFVGLKLHPYAFCASPTSPQAQKVYLAAELLHKPVMIHTGNGVPAALPSLVIPVAMAHPNIKFVLAHSGNTMFGEEALIAAKLCSNIYLETSWTTVYFLKSFIKELGAERVMFGVDSPPSNCSIELAKYYSLHLTNEQYEQVFSKTAISVFGLK